MNPQSQMLLWSEWRQRRAQFLFCLLWLVGGACYSIAYELTHRFRAGCQLL